MENGFMNKVIGLVLVLVIGASLVGGLLVPTVQAVTATETTFENEGLYYMINPDEPMNVKFLGGTEWEIDGETLDYSPYGATNIIATDSFFIRNVGQVRGSVYASWEAADLTIDNGTITGTATAVGGQSTTVNYTYTQAFVATNEKSDNIMSLPTKTTYIKGDSSLIGEGLSRIKNATGEDSQVAFFVKAEGESVTVNCDVADVAITNVQLNRSAVEGYINLYLFESVTFTTTWGEYTTDCTYNIIITPAEVTAEKAQHMDAAQIAIFGVVSLLGIVLLVTIAASAVRSKY